MITMTCKFKCGTSMSFQRLTHESFPTGWVCEMCAELPVQLETPQMDEPEFEDEPLNVAPEDTTSETSAEFMVSVTASNESSTETELYVEPQEEASTEEEAMSEASEPEMIAPKDTSPVEPKKRGRKAKSK